MPLNTNGVYTGLWKKQSGFTISEDGGKAGIEAERLSAVPLLAGLRREFLSDIARGIEAYTSVATTDRSRT